MTEAAPLVRLLDITKRFPGVLANDAVSLAIRPGEVHALLGENGAGKSTLIAILAGVQQPDAGHIEIGGARVALASPREAIRQGIGTVYQHSTLVPNLTVAENLALGRRWWQGSGRAAVLARLAEVSALLGVTVDADAMAGSLSLGQQQQVEIIKALWRGERVLVLDEPTSMLTPKGVAELGAAMRRLAAAGMAVVFVTHKLNEVLAFGDRVSVLRLGRKVGEIAPGRFRAMPAAEATQAIVGMMFGRGEAEAGVVAEFRGEAMRHPGRRGGEVLAVALPGIGFALRAGEVFGVAGVDGNGQRELCEALAGQARAPRVVLAGEDVSALGVAARQARGLRYLTDDRLGEGTIGAFSVALNLLLKRVGEPPYWRRGIADEAAIRAQGAATIAEYDVRTPGPDTPIARLSGGNIQKALFARELHGAPRVLIAAKPTYGLDLANIRAARERIRAAADSGVAVILVSNELDELLELSDRIGVMRRGRMVGIVANGPAAGREVGQLMVGG